MTQDNCNDLLVEVREYLGKAVGVRPLKGDTCLVRTPFFDQDGDPISLAVATRGDVVTIDDIGTIAGHLFTLGQHTQDTPAFKLLKQLEKAYELHLNFDNGIVEVSVPRQAAMSAIMDLTKIIITMVTVTPHIRVQPHRLKPLGPRLRTKIRNQYADRDILNLVEADYELAGVAVDSWTVDFHWWLRADENVTQHVYVLAVDLNVMESLAKAHRIATLAIDAKRNIAIDSLRVVVDRHGENSDASVAESLLRKHSDRLGYKVFDFDADQDRQQFLEQSAHEILSEAGEPWRRFWTERATFTSS